MPFVPTGWASRSSRGPSLDSSKDKSSILSWARALLQSSPSSQQPFRRTRLPTYSPLHGSSHEVCSPSASPRTRQQHDDPGLPHPTHLRPQVFSTSRRFHLPRACRPCFVPDPLVGLHPPELCSSRAAVRRLRRRSPLVVGRPRSSCSSSRTEVLAASQAPLTSPAYRGLLHARVRRQPPAV
jgi:hypothetical protein